MDMILFCQRCFFPAHKLVCNTTGSIGKRHFTVSQRSGEGIRRVCLSTGVSVQGPSCVPILYRAQTPPDMFKLVQLGLHCALPQQAVSWHSNENAFL